MKKFFFTFVLLSLWGLSTHAQCLALSTDNFCGYTTITILNSNSGTWLGPGIVSGQGTNTITVNVAGNYLVTSNGCSATIFVHVFFSPVATISSTPTTCNGSGGTATVTVTGGTAPFLINWSNGGTTQTINNLAAGSYTVTVVDYHDCQATGTVVVESGSNPVTLGFDTFCDFTTITAYGCESCSSYQWLGPGIVSGQGTAIVSVNIAGTYSVTVNGCTTSMQVPVFFSPAVSFTTTPVNCSGVNGSATATVTSGTAPYMYLWINGATTATVSNLTVGTYFVTVTDQHDCKGTSSVVLEGNIVSDSTFVSKDTCIILDDTYVSDSCGTVVVTTWHWLPAFRDTITLDTCVAGINTIADTTRVGNCDGIIWTNFNFVPKNLPDTTIFTCYGSLVDTVFFVTSPLGCVTKQIIHRLNYSQATGSETMEVCAGSFPFIWNGLTIPSVGNYTAILAGSSMNGCDSTATLEVTLISKITKEQTVRVCAGDLFTFQGTTYAHGIYDFLGTSSTGCDSIFTLVVEEYAVVQVTEVVFTTCDSNLLGVLVDTLQSFLGCDSIVVTTTTLGADCFEPPVGTQECDVIITHLDGPNPIRIWIDPVKAPSGIKYILWSPQQPNSAHTGSLISGENQISVIGFKPGFYLLQIFTKKQRLRTKNSDGSFSSGSYCIRI